MNKYKNARSKIWLYAVVLFTSAFIVLLLTAYSQIKLNKNLSDLNNEVYNKEHENKQVQLSFANAQELNSKLTEENKALQDEKDSIALELAQLKYDKDAGDILYKSKLDTYDKLCQAQSDYMEGKIVESADMIENIDAGLLNAYGSELYGQLKNKTYAEAGKLLLNEGYGLYQKKEYAAAVEKLKKSREYAPYEGFSDKCLYYLAQAEVKTGNMNEGIEQMKTLVGQFPSSHYISAAKRFLTKYSD